MFSQQVAEASSVLPFMLMFMVFVMGTSCTLQSLRSVALAPRRFLVALFVVYVLMPVLGYGIGRLFYAEGSPYAVGHLLIAVTPVAITSTVWTGMSHGNIALSLALVTFVTVVSGFYIPLQMSVFAGRTVEFDSFVLMGNLVRTIVLPVLLGIFVRHRSRGGIQAHRSYLDLITKVMMLVLLAVNGAVVRPHLQQMDGRLLRSVLVVTLHTSLNFAVGYLASMSLLGKRDRSLPTVVYAASMKNNAAGIVIALSHFGPLVALPVVLNMILQQFWASAYYRVFSRLFPSDA